MADLFRTVDGEGDEEASQDEAVPVLTRRGGFGFDDLVSEDEDEEAARWDFDVHEVGGHAALPGPINSLTEKIQARLLEKKTEEVEGDEAREKGNRDATEGRPARKPGKVKAKSKANANSGTAEHLSTDVHFAELRLSRPLLRAVADLHFRSPTPVQRDVIPHALRGVDVLATAETGSGKTASFLLPALERLCQSANVRARRRDASGVVVAWHVATKALVLIPTRELAVQCHAMLKDLAKYTLVTHQLVTGGFVSQEQSTSLRQQPDLVVATPGRMLDHLLNSQSVHMELLEIVVFDEADRLLELGFRAECTQVLKCCSKGRQTMLFSATLNASVEDLAALALVKPVRVHASPVNRVVQTLEQEFVKCPSDALREAVLLGLCERNYTARVIIFCATRHAAHRLAIIFGLSGLRFAEIHGNLPQAERVKALQKFQNQNADFLLATDLAARGLDLCNVETVMNFHLPLDASRYIHRVGRTARMGRVGRAVTIYCPEEYAKVKSLGRQCCSKVASKVLKRTVAADVIQRWAEKIDGFADDIDAIAQDEALERELRLADVLTDKSENLQKHKESIHARPAREWYMTNGQKRQLKEADNERAKASAKAGPEPAAAAGSAAGSTAGGAAGSGKRTQRARERESDEAAEARRKRRAKERLLERRQAEKEERAQSERRNRIAAKRARRAARPVKGTKGTGAPQPQQRLKRGKRRR